MKKCLLLLCTVLVSGLLSARQVQYPVPIGYNSPIAGMMVQFYGVSVHIWADNDSVAHLNDKPLFAARIKNGKLNGPWQSWYQNGLPCDSGNFVKGLPDGVWKHWNEKGQLLALRTYSADKHQRIDNEMIRFNPRRINYPLASLYQVNRQAALQYMKMSYSFPNAGEQITGLTLSELVTKNITGNNYRPVFDRTLHHGLFMNFYPDGRVKDSGYYRNGLRQGIWVHRDIEKATRQKGTYHNGIKVKEWRTYAESGKLLELVVYGLKGGIKKKRYFQ
jgi:antitoxin component YwqK of YwqJK toxin-antitoxin module